MTWAADENMLIVNWALSNYFEESGGVPLSISLKSQYYDLGGWWKYVDS